jgi:hypothetical protein
MSKCLECGYYDKEKHYCPFYCQLIRETLDEAISFELEKIKAEIDNCLIHNPDYNECNVNIGLGISYEIKKKHISELKGENNETGRSIKKA